MSFGLFAPSNVTVTVVLFLSALAVAGAIQTILDLSRPFEGVIRVCAEPLRHALEVIHHLKGNLPWAGQRPQFINSSRSLRASSV